MPPISPRNYVYVFTLSCLGRSERFGIDHVFLVDPAVDRLGDRLAVRSRTNPPLAGLIAAEG